MKTLQSLTTDPYFNLAWEEYILKHIHKDEDILLLWQNDTSIIIGRNQNVFEEVNLDYIVKSQIPLIRRISGGGTVFHDLGNLNYTYITRAKGNINNYRKMTESIIEALKQLDIDASFVEKSDIKLGDKKISGNAQFVFGEKLLHHGTLLIKSNLDLLKPALKEKVNAIESISVKSNRSSVTNLCDHSLLSMEAIKDQLTNTLLKDATLITLTPKDLKHIEALKNEKYLTYAWNYGESPKSMIQKSLDNYQIKVTVNYGMIEEALIIKDGTLSLLLSSELVGERLFPKELSFLIKKAPEVYQMLFT